MFADRFRVDPDKFRLKDCDPADTAGRTAEAAEGDLARDLEEMIDLQKRFYAARRHALLLIFQAPDAGGKDGTIKHVMSGLNPAGCRVHSFKAPSAEELEHDYLWRCVARLPERGYMGVFNRSYYEEVLVVRVHPEFLAAEGVAPDEAGKSFWNRRFKDIVHFEDYLTRNHVRVVKFFLNVSKKEQKKRLLRRLEDPSRNWKFSASDYKERQLWDAYQAAYDEAIRRTSTEHAPWYVIPADEKWFAHLAVARVLVETLRDLKPAYPEASGEQLAEVRRFRELLEKEE